MYIYIYTACLFCICMLRLISSSACLCMHMYVTDRVNEYTRYLSLLACLHEHASTTGTYSSNQVAHVLIRYVFNIFISIRIKCFTIYGD